MTEDEAKELSCCGPSKCGRLTAPDHPHSARRCIASRCMAWRWDDAASLDKPTRVHPNVLKDHWHGWTVTDPTPDAKGYVEISPPPPKLPHGHCGLAGKP